MKKFYSTICFCTLLLCSLQAVKAQDGFRPGFIILADGTRIAGAIRLRAEDPWINQRRIWFKDSASLATQKEVKPKKYSTDELSYYQVGERRFEKVHYVDMENLQLKSLGTNNHMLEKLSSGRLTAYRFYQYPKDFDGFYGTEEAYKAYKEQLKSDLMMGFKFLTKKDNEAKFHDAFDYDLQKFFEDTPEVLKKYQAGEYGNQPVSTKTGFMAKMIAQAKRHAYKPEEAQAIITAFDDYNQKNAGKQ